MNKNLLIFAGLFTVVLVAYLGYELLGPGADRCEGVFQQTAPSLASNIKILESEGNVVLGRKQVQELSERAQEVAINLKACCLMSGDDERQLERFLQCKNTASRYEAQIASAAQVIKQLESAKKTSEPIAQAETKKSLQEILQAALETSKELEEQVRPPPEKPGNLRLRAALTKEGDPLQACFKVYAPEVDVQGNRRRVASDCRKTAIFTLPAGDYVVTAAAGQASVTKPLTVTPGKTTDQLLDLDAGYLRVGAALTKDGDPLQACFSVYFPEVDVHGNRRRIAYDCRKTAIFTLPAGDYVVTAAAGQASVTKPLTVTPGKTTDQLLDLNAGYLRLGAALTKDGDPLQACFSVYVPEVDVHGNRRRIAYDCSKNAVFTLPAGDYVVTAAAGQASVTKPLTVTPGKITDQLLDLNGGYLRARAALTKDGDPLRACFSVYAPEVDLHGNRRRIAYDCSKNAIFTLPAGEYFVTAQSGKAEQEMTITIQPGATTDSPFLLPPSE